MDLRQNKNFPPTFDSVCHYKPSIYRSWRLFTVQHTYWAHPHSYSGFKKCKARGTLTKHQTCKFYLQLFSWIHNPQHLERSKMPPMHCMSGWGTQNMVIWSHHKLNVMSELGVHGSLGLSVCVAHKHFLLSFNGARGVRVLCIIKVNVYIYGRLLKSIL